MSHASKKSEITFEFLIKLFLFAIVVLLFVLPLVVKLYGMIGGKAKPATINSMDLLAKEIKYLEDETDIPLYIDDKHIIKGFDMKAGDKPANCKKEYSCLCTCKKDGCTPKNIEQCVNVEYALGATSIHLDDTFNLQPTERVTNFHVAIAGDTVSIKELPGVTTG